MNALGKMKRWGRRRVESVIRETPNTHLVYRPGADFCFPREEGRGPEPLHRGLPVPPAELMQGYGPTAEQFIALGEEHTGTMLRLLAESGYKPGPGDRILDHGCGAGRMTRCLSDYAQDCEVWGTDINAEYMYWCRAHLSPPFHFATTTTIPHLPFEDRSFALVYCGSLFTHLDDLTDAWLLELRRILAPGGRLYVTIHDEHTMKLIGQDSHAMAAYTKASIVGQTLTGSAIGDGFGMFVFNRGGGWGVQTFYEQKYFCRLLAPGYRVLSVTPEAYGIQTAVLAERR